MTDTLPALLGVVGRTLVVYLGVVLGLRLVGKRELGQLGIPDLVVVLLLANAVQNAMVGTDASVPAGLVSAGTLLVANLVVTRARLASPVLGRLIEGVPTVLVRDGVAVTENVRREGIDDEELLSVVREHGLERLADVQLAVLEPDGTVSVVPQSSPVLRSRRRVRQMRRH
ncbi:MAG: DUF421 domain-containing protein [Actinomycetota bacterium]